RRARGTPQSTGPTSLTEQAMRLARFPARPESPPFYPDKAKLLVWRDAAGKQHPVATPADWARRRAHILANMQLVMGPLPGEDRKMPPDVRVVEAKKFDGYVRTKITLAGEHGDRLPAYIVVPDGREGTLRAVLCLRPTSYRLGKDVAAMLGPKKDRGYAVRLVERGYVTLAPDYPNMGEYKVDPYKLGYASTTMKA